jgi:iron(III) transport system permease protein
MDNRIAAAQLATLLAGTGGGAAGAGAPAQHRMRFAVTKGARAGSADAQAVCWLGASGWSVAWLLCGMPILMGLCTAGAVHAAATDRGLGGLAVVAVWRVGVQQRAPGRITAMLAVGVALMLAFSVRRSRHWARVCAAQLAGLGYAIPGAVVVVGLLLPVGWLQAWAPDWQVGYWVTATAVGIVWAYLVRFCAVALQATAKWLRAAAHQSGRLGPHAGRIGPADAGACALAAVAPLGRGCVCWCLWTS